MKIYPSLISANPLYLGDIIKKLAPHCAGFHCDVMDNHFVDNLTFGAETVNAIDAATSTQTWVHLMVDNPLDWPAKLEVKADSIITFHLESTEQIETMIKSIKEKNWLASIAINPKTAIEEIYPWLNAIDQVLIMSVNPGHSGQRFLAPVIDKVAPLLALQKKDENNFSIAMDGGINIENIEDVARAGVQDSAVASAIFDSPDPVAALEALKKRVEK